MDRFGACAPTGTGVAACCPTGGTCRSCLISLAGMLTGCRRVHPRGCAFVFPARMLVETAGTSAGFRLTGASLEIALAFALVLIPAGSLVPHVLSTGRLITLTRMLFVSPLPACLISRTGHRALSAMSLVLRLAGLLHIPRQCRLGVLRPFALCILRNVLLDVVLKVGIFDVVPTLIDLVRVKLGRDPRVVLQSTLTLVMNPRRHQAETVAIMLRQLAAHL
jgi:hypothetical protein